MRRKLLRAVVLLLLLVAAALVWLIVSPSPIDPAAYEPPPPPAMTGPLAPNELLRRAERLGLGQVHGPEDVAVDAAGRIYGGCADGRVVRLAPDGQGIETFAQTGGRPLGLHFDAAGNLLVADAKKGLLSIDPTGRIDVLATGAEGVPFGFTDDVKTGADGTVYFTDASDRFGIGEHLYDLLEARPHGRLLAYDPASKKVRVLLRDLYFANGVALSQAGDFLLVVETYRNRLRRLWLRGPRAGTSDVFADNLPGYPDGVAADGRGTFWVAMFTVRNAMADRLQPRPWAKRLLAKLPSFAWPKPESYGLVLAYDEQGRLLRSLQDPGGKHVPIITSVQPEGDVLYLGTLTGDWIGRYRLK
ncbi:MAG TPA: SMP-30/gluconolactonase/LRE family protein [Thermoanaerobaculia bacterium]|nr:SMP-30/gluconolactonase/LRE family protein [Thermoanaerobaculia bacterium]